MGITSDGQKHEIKEKSLVAAKTAFFYTGIIRATVPIPGNIINNIMILI